MSSDRRLAIVAGVLFIVGLAGVVTLVLTQPILDDPGYLIRISTNENRILVGALFQLIIAAACAGIGVALYPQVALLPPSSTGASWDRWLGAGKDKAAGHPS